MNWPFKKYWFTEIYTSSKCWHISLHNIKISHQRGPLSKHLKASSLYGRYTFSENICHLKTWIIGNKKYHFFWSDSSFHLLWENICCENTQVWIIIVSHLFFEGKWCSMKKAASSAHSWKRHPSAFPGANYGRPYAAEGFRHTSWFFIHNIRTMCAEV